jgi:hypothetical protein
MWIYVIILLEYLEHDMTYDPSTPGGMVLQLVINGGIGIVELRDSQVSVNALQYGRAHPASGL